MGEQSVTIELNPDERRLYERLRSRIVSAKPRTASSGLLDLVFLLPDLTVLLARLLRDERVPLFSKAVLPISSSTVSSRTFSASTWQLTRYSR